MGTVRVPLWVTILVFGGEHHAGQVAHGVWQVPGQKPEIYGVVLLRTVEVEGVFAGVPALFPVFQLDVEDRVAPGQ